MIREYPDYYKKFVCIGGRCPDSCCIGWEVDIDEETFYYYCTVPGEFGERLREHMADTGEEKYFPMTADRRCPFLNAGNLCDIILHLGEESLCQVCTEYPRYYIAFDNYEQIDMSLSCMELGRLFFSSDDPVCFIREEVPGEGEGISAEERKILLRLLRSRDSVIARLKDRSVPFSERVGRIFGQDPLTGLCIGHDSGQETDAQLLLLMSRLEVLDERWIHELEAVSSLLQTEKEKDRPEGGSEERRSAGETVTRLQTEIWFEKLAVYFTFRYAPDAFPDGDLQPVRRLIRRSLRFLALMCRARVWKNGSFQREDMIDIAHMYSKEVEHSEENVEFMKR